MGKFLVAATALSGLLAISGSVLAADLAVPADPAYDWSGPYIGVQGGYLWSDSTATDFLNNGAGPLHGSGDVDPDGWFGGAYTGYNWQTNNFVFGLEADVNIGDLDGSDDTIEFAGGVRPATWDYDSDMGVFGSARLRFGYAVDRFMPYLTGGVAGADYDVRMNHNGDVNNSSEFMIGWTVGAGAEWAVTDSLSARIEYRYTDYGNINDTFDGFPSEDVDIDLTTSVAQIGLSWKF